MDEEIKNVQNEDGINEETAEETTANAEVEEEPIGNIKISVDVVLRHNFKCLVQKCVTCQNSGCLTEFNMTGRHTAS